MRAAKRLNLMKYFRTGNLAGDDQNLPKMTGSEVPNPWINSHGRFFYCSQVKNQPVAALSGECRETFAAAWGQVPFGLDPCQDEAQRIPNNGRLAGGKDVPLTFLQPQPSVFTATRRGRCALRIVSPWLTTTQWHESTT